MQSLGKSRCPRCILAAPTDSTTLLATVIYSSALRRLVYGLASSDGSNHHPTRRNRGSAAVVEPRCRDSLNHRVFCWHVGIIGTTGSSKGLHCWLDRQLIAHVALRGNFDESKPTFRGLIPYCRLSREKQESSRSGHVPYWILKGRTNLVAFSTLYTDTIRGGY